MNNQLIIKKPMALILTLVILLSIAGSAYAQDDRAAPVRNESTAPSQPQGPTDPAELEAFLDELFAKDMEEHQIAGAAVSVVKDGQVLLAKGYGSADLEKGIPVDPEQTMFRIGSVSKLFAWTAVMQLAEQGKLDLDADVNTYLDFRIPDTYPGPITLKHLLTHTAGFEELVFEIMMSAARGQVPAGEWLASHMPARVRPPGDIAAYSNYGTSLAGYIVARVAGQPYEQYIQEHILNPLGILQTTAQALVPPGLRAYESKGYSYKDGRFEVYPDYLSPAGTIPGGGMYASATDMARFMIAHLQDGRYSDANNAERHILKDATMEQMHSTLYTPDPRLLGTAYGFFDFSDNGQRTIGHSGSMPGMNSLLLLLPDQNLGVFVTYNSEGGGNLTNQHLGFQRSFFDHYYPAQAAKPIQPPADFSKRAGQFVGSYQMSRGSYTTLEKVIGLFGAVEISDSGDGGLLFKTPWGEWRFVEVEPLYFRQADGQFSLVFRQDDRGRITYMFANLTPQFAYEKLNWYETAGFNLALVLGCILIFLSMIPVAAIRLIRNRRLSSERKPAPGGARVANWIILGISVLNLVFLVGIVLVLRPGLVLWGNPMPLFGVSMIYKIVLGLGVLAAALTAGALVYTALAWKNRYWGIAGRVYYTLVTVAAVAFVWFLNYWNLLGWRY